MVIILKKIVFLIIAVFIVTGVSYAMYDIINTVSMNSDSRFSNKEDVNEDNVNSENSNVVEKPESQQKERILEKEEKWAGIHEEDLQVGIVEDENKDKNVVDTELIAKGEYKETNETEKNIPDIQRQSEALEALKDFYGYLGSEDDYYKAIDMLHDEFKLEIDILKTFGIKNLKKSDLNVNDTTVYSDFFGAVKLKAIVNEQSFPDTVPMSSVICYVQNVTIADMSVEQTIEAKLIEENDAWKLLSLVEKTQS